MLYTYYIHFACEWLNAFIFYECCCWHQPQPSFVVAVAVGVNTTTTTTTAITAATAITTFHFSLFSIPLSFHFSFHLLPLNYPRLCDLYIVLRKLLTRMLPFTQSPLPLPLSLYLFISYFLGHPYFNKYCNTWMYQHCVCSFSFHRNQLWSAQARILLLLLLLYLFNIYGNLSNAKTKHVKHPRFVRKMTDILW